MKQVTIVDGRVVEITPVFRINDWVTPKGHHDLHGRVVMVEGDSIWVQWPTPYSWRVSCTPQELRHRDE